jgi:hypothetical protein
MKKVISILVSLVFCFSLFAQAPIVEKAKDTAKIVKLDTAVKDTCIPVAVFTKISAKLDSLAQVSASHKAEKLELLFGGVPPYVYQIAFIFVFLGMFLRWYYTTRKGIKNPENGSPAKFNFIYWIKDNLLSKLFAMLSAASVIFVTLRFSNELFGVEISMIYAFFVGLFFDYVADYLMSINPTKVFAKKIVTEPTQPTDAAPQA